MTRSKLRLEYITNNYMRKATFKKRKSGFLKKLTELTTLCGVEACAVIYSSYDSQPDVWPSPLGAQHVINRYRVVPDMVQKKKAMTHESFIKHRTMAIDQRLEKMRRVNSQKQTELLVLENMFELEYLRNLSHCTKSDVVRQIDKNLMGIKKRMEDMEKEEAQNGDPTFSSWTVLGQQRLSDQTQVSRGIQLDNQQSLNMVMFDNEDVYRPELPPLAHQVLDYVNNLSPENGENQNMYLGMEEEGLHLAFADINQEENAFWTEMFP